MKKFISAILMISLLFLMGGCIEEEPNTEQPNTEVPSTEDPNTEEPIDEEPNTNPIFLGDGTYTLDIDNMDITFGMSATDAEDGDVTDRIYVIDNGIDYTIPGDYPVVLGVTDSRGGFAETLVAVTVPELTILYPSGTFNLRDLDAETYMRYMQAAESYLYNQLIGGIPLYENSRALSLYNDRVTVPTNKFLPLLEFGEFYGELSTMDKDVAFVEGYNYIDNEYTFRTHINYDIYSYNHFLYDSEVTSLFMGSLYRYDINDEGNGIKIVPYMAEGEPHNEAGAESSTVWRVTLGANMWKFHPDTDQTFLNSNPDMEITSSDYVDTFKIVLDNLWLKDGYPFHNICTSLYEIVGICDYMENVEDNITVDFNTVGIKALDDNTIEITFVNEQSVFDVKYFLSTTAFTPIHTGLYEYLQDGNTNTYGSSNTTIGYHGGYYVEEANEDYIKLAKSNELPQHLIYNYDNILFYIESEYDEVLCDMFNDGLLDRVQTGVLSSCDFSKGYLLKGPGTSIYSIQFNGLKTTERYLEMFPDSDYEVEPILGNEYFAQALFYVVDRNAIVDEYGFWLNPSITYYPDIYRHIDSGMYYRDTEFGSSVYENYSPATNGYDLGRAKQLFLKALDELIEEGYYAPGTEDNYTIIELDFNYLSGGDIWAGISTLLEEGISNAFVDDERFIKVELTSIPVDFPEIYYDYYDLGEFDLSYFGFSTSVLCPGRLYTFDDNCYGRFHEPLVYEIDQSEINIPVFLKDENNNTYIEMWSYELLKNAFYEELILIEGVSVKDIDIDISNITPVSFDVTVNELIEDVHTNMLITVQTYDFDTHEYVNVEGYVDIPYLGETITFDNLIPGFYDGVDNYLGDYQILITFDVVVDEVATPVELITPWFVLPSTVEIITDNTTTNAVDIDIEIHESISTEIVSVKILDTDYQLVANAVYSDNNVSYDGLTTNTEYILEFTYTDGLVDYKMITTK